METRSNDRYTFDDNSDDVRGWPVRDLAGKELGSVAALFTDEKSEFITMITLDDGTQLRAHDLEIDDGFLVYRAPVVKAARPAVAPVQAVRPPVAAVRAAEPVRRAEPVRPVEQRRDPPRVAAGEIDQKPVREPRMLDDIVVQLVDEELDINKRQYGNGGIHVETHIVKEPISTDVRLREERVTVGRNKVDRVLSDADAARLFHDETYEMKGTSQVPVVDKYAHVVEEIRIKKNAADRNRTVRDTVRHMEADVVELRGGRP